MIDTTGFPLLTPSNHGETSPVDPEYNCIAWAAGDQHRYWWPDEDGDGYWPVTATRAETIDAFLEAFQAIGYVPDPNNDPRLEVGIEKIAVFAKGADPTHAARQLPDGKWTSKMGPDEDIWHDWGVLDGPCYGTFMRVLRREMTRAAVDRP